MSTRMIRPFTLALALTLALAACVDLSTSSSGSGGSGGTGGTAGTSGDGGSTATPTGAQCVTEQESGAVLCSAISTCPDVVVDRDVFPNCGFRIMGSTMDLECDCNGQLCPLGVPVTCAQAAQLLMQQQSETNVCTQVSEGRCTMTANPAPTTTGTPSTCDPGCRDGCSGDPSCYKLCGC